MVLYHASTMYHLLYCIVHKLAFHKDDDADILMVEYIKPLKEQKEFYDKLMQYGFFKNARYVPEQKFKLKKGIALDENSSEKQINTVIENISSAFTNWYKDDLSKYDEFYIASDQHSLGIHLIKNKIPYTYMEDASGMLSEQSRYLSITKGNNLTNHIINEYLGCAGRNDYVKAKLCDLKHQLPGFHDEKAVDFSIYDTLKNVIPEESPVLLSFFGNITTTIKSDKKICLFLTQDLNTLRVKDLDLQELTCTSLVDYICPDHTLVIKPHPKDRWQNYKRIFPDSLLLEKRIPAELLPFMIDGTINTALTASSTSVRGVTEFAEKSYSFTTEIETNRERIDSMYAVTEILKEIGVTSGVSARNINMTQISCFLDNADIQSDGDSVIIDGGISRDESFDFSNHKLVLCLNLGNVLNYDPKNNEKNMYIIRVSYKPEENSLFEEKQHMIFAYCIDDAYIEKFEKLHFNRTLKYSKAKVEVSCEKITNEAAEKLNAKLRRDMEWEEN